MNEHPRVLSAAAIIGDKLVNSEGEQLGIIKDLMIDLDDVQVAYAMLSFSGGLLDLGDTLLAVPLEALTFGAEEHTVVLDVDEEVLKNAPRFDKEYWAEDAQYEAGSLLNIYEYGGYSPYRIPDK